VSYALPPFRGSTHNITERNESQERIGDVIKQVTIKRFLLSLRVCNHPSTFSE